MEREIGIVICNYNKCDYIIKCIQSVLESSICNFDVYVVDNASTDESVTQIREKFGKSVNLIVNKENVGGSGGFNTGVRETLKAGYKYIMLLDNDVIIDKNAIFELYDFLEKNPKVGTVGSKVYFMDYPDKIWGYGGNINFQTYIQNDSFKNESDHCDIPEVHFCDYVAACSLMARADAIRDVGLMPEENFIYWDDIEWGYRFNEKGYQVAVCGKSKIWHKAGGRNVNNTFIHYYMWRNRIRFFIKVLSKEERKLFSKVILSEMFRMIYSCKLKNESNIVTSLMYAFDDAVHGVSGKASDYKILERPMVKNRVCMALEGMEEVVIQFDGNFEGLENIKRVIKKYCPDSNIKIILDSEVVKNLSSGKIEALHLENEVIYQCSEQDKTAIFHMCPHIFDIGEDLPQGIYIDPWCNIIFTKEDYLYAQNYSVNKELFCSCMMPLILQN